MLLTLVVLTLCLQVVTQIGTSFSLLIGTIRQIYNPFPYPLFLHTTHNHELLTPKIVFIRIANITHFPYFSTKLCLLVRLFFIKYNL